MLCVDCGGICCFADDSSYSFSSKVAEVISGKITEKFRDVSNYKAFHELKFNSDKIHIMLLISNESRQAKPNFSITLDTQEEIIQTSRQETLLGGIMCQNLMFSEHIQDNEASMLKILNNRLNALKTSTGTTGGGI